MKDLHKGDKGPDVRAHQTHLNERLRIHRDPPIEVDGEVGPVTVDNSAYAAWFLGADRDVVDRAKRGLISVHVQEMVADPTQRSAEAKRRARGRRDEHFGSLRVRALHAAEGLVGVMESGGNNTGPMVTKIIRANGGTGPEPWCGDFVAYCYTLAGSQGVDRRWASVSLSASDPDVHVIARASVEPGDLLRYTFDHFGMFKEWVDQAAGTMHTIEGNTTSAGAISDGDGHDGVYVKNRSWSQVHDALRVER